MAITITAGAWAAGTTSVAPAFPASPLVGDIHIIFVGSKPYNTTHSTPTGFTLISGTNATNGTVANGVDVGSVHMSAFYRRFVTGDTAPSCGVTSGNVALGVCYRFRPSTGFSLYNPVGAYGSDTTSGTGFSCTMASNIGIDAGDALVAASVIAGDNSTFGTPTLTATGVTMGTVTENPATEGTTTGGNDLEASGMSALPSAGPASAAAVVGWTLSVAQTGMSVLARVREHEARCTKILGIEGDIHQLLGSGYTLISGG
jgi:hypothetical protein